MSHPDTLLFFDGVCHFCNSSVQWVVRRDKQRQFYFASLQSPYAHQRLQPVFQDRMPDSVVLYHRGQYYVKSAAVFKMLSLLGYPYSWLRVAAILPTRFTDACYDYFARNRYTWFGQYDVCQIPNESVKARFMDA